MCYKFYFCSDSRGQRYHIFNTTVRSPHMLKMVHLSQSNLLCLKKPYPLKIWGFFNHYIFKKSWHIGFV